MPGLLAQRAKTERAKIREEIISAFFLANKLYSNSVKQQQHQKRN